MSITPPKRVGPARADIAIEPAQPTPSADGRPALVEPAAAPGRGLAPAKPELEIAVPLGPGVRAAPSIRAEGDNLVEVSEQVAAALAASSNGRVAQSVNGLHQRWIGSLVSAMRSTADDAADALESSDPAQGRLAAWLSHHYAAELAALGAEGSRNDIIRREIGIDALDALSDSERMQGPDRPVVPRGSGLEAGEEERLTAPPSTAELVEQLGAVDRAYAAAAAAAAAGDVAAYQDAKSNLAGALSSLDETLYNLRVDAVGPLFHARLLRLEEGLRRSAPPSKELGLPVDSPSALLAAQRMLGLSR